MSPNTERIFAKAYRPTIYALCALGVSAWGVVAAVDRFQKMVDARAQEVVEKFSAAPLQEQKEFREHFARNDAAIDKLVASVAQTNADVNRLVGAVDQMREQARLPTIPVRTSGYSGK